MNAWLGRGVWGGMLGLAVLWPSRLISPLDGVPLDGRLEAVLLGLVLPILWWLHPRFLGTGFARTVVASLCAWKLGTWLLLTQGGWCAQFVTSVPIGWRGATPIAVEVTGIQRSWDLRTDWRAPTPTCSAIVTRAYPTLYHFPVWFTNMLDAQGRPPKGTFTMQMDGHMVVPERGTFSLLIGEEMRVEGSIGSSRLVLDGATRQDVLLETGTHRVHLNATLTGSSWRLVPLWNGTDLWRTVQTAVAVPSTLDRVVWRSGSFVTPCLIALLLVGWMVAGVRTVRPNLSVAAWVIGASLVMGMIGWDARHVGSDPHYSRFAALLLFGGLLIPVSQRLRNVRGAFLMLGIPWLSFFVVKRLEEIGWVTLYTIGDDWLTYQQFAYRIFMEGYWLEGGEWLFWRQPLYRWILGVLHLVFGDSSIGEVYWDCVGLTIAALFGFHIVKTCWGFRLGLLTGATTLATFALGPIWFSIGRGLSEISAAAWAYLAAFHLLRARLGRQSSVFAAGVFAILAFYTRLNHLLFVVALIVLVLPLTLPASSWTPLRGLIRRIPPKIALTYLGCVALGVLLFALRSWYYTGMFTVFFGTQQGHTGLGLLKPATLFSPQVWGRVAESLLMVMTVHDPPRPNPFHDPRGFVVLCGTVFAFLALLRVPGFRRLPLAPCLVCLGAVAFAVFVRGNGYAGRFSVHLVPVATAMSVGVLAMVARGLLARLTGSPAVSWSHGAGRKGVTRIAHVGGSHVFPTEG